MTDGGRGGGVADEGDNGGDANDDEQHDDQEGQGIEMCSGKVDVQDARGTTNIAAKETSSQRYRP